MLPTLVNASKALRLPLHSKRANKDYFKGTRTGNIMVRKRVARANRYTGQRLGGSFNVKTNRIDESRVESYIVPPGLMDCKLQPLVYIGSNEDGGIDKRPPPGYPGIEPSRPKGGLDGRMYEQLVDKIRQRRFATDGVPLPASTTSNS